MEKNSRLSHGPTESEVGREARQIFDPRLVPGHPCPLQPIRPCAPHTKICRLFRREQVIRKDERETTLILTVRGQRQMQHSTSTALYIFPSFTYTPLRLFHLDCAASKIIAPAVNRHLASSHRHRSPTPCPDRCHSW